MLRTRVSQIQLIISSGSPGQAGFGSQTDPARGLPGDRLRVGPARGRRSGPWFRLGRFAHRAGPGRQGRRATRSSCPRRVGNGPFAIISADHRPRRPVVATSGLALQYVGPRPRPMQTPVSTPYPPHLRTAVLLTGAGTAGAYHAGALRALVEGGIKIDIVAAHGAGVLTALAAAVDGGARVWDSAGPWTDPRLRHAYRWRPALRVAFAGFVASVAVLLSPLLVLVVAAVVYAAATVAALVSLTSVAASLVSMYSTVIEALLNPPILPTILPRLLVVAVLVIAGVLVTAAVAARRRERSRRKVIGAFWWRLLSSPLGCHRTGGDRPGDDLAARPWRLRRRARAVRPRSGADMSMSSPTTLVSRASMKSSSPFTTLTPGVTWSARFSPRRPEPCSRAPRRWRVFGRQSPGSHGATPRGAAGARDRRVSTPDCHRAGVAGVPTRQLLAGRTASRVRSSGPGHPVGR